MRCFSTNSRGWALAAPALALLVGCWGEGPAPTGFPPGSGPTGPTGPSGSGGCVPACPDDNPCNGVETCISGTCLPGTDLADQASCGTDAECFSGLCEPVACRDGNVNTNEDCDDDNDTPGDGCENDCTLSCFLQDPISCPPNVFGASLRADVPPDGALLTDIRQGDTAYIWVNGQYLEGTTGVTLAPDGAPIACLGGALVTGFYYCSITIPHGYVPGSYPVRLHHPRGDVDTTTLTISPIWVMTTGNDSARGPVSEPFATLERALQVAGAGDTIRVGPGTFTAGPWLAYASGAEVENSTTSNLPPGITIEGASRDGTIFTPPSPPSATAAAFVANSSATFRSFTVSGFAYGIIATVGGTVLIEHVKVNEPTQGGVFVDDAPVVTANNVWVEASTYGGFLSFKTSQLTLNDSRATNCGYDGVYVRNSSTLTVNGGMYSNNVNRGFVIWLDDAVTTASITDAEVANNGIVGYRVNCASMVTFTGGSISGNGSNPQGSVEAGISAICVDAVRGVGLDIDNVDITDNVTRGLHLAGRFDVKVRGSTISGNDGGAGPHHGIFLDANGTTYSPTLDLGTSGDPGGNTFGANGTGTSGAYHFIFEEADAVAVKATIHAWGNIHNPNPPQPSSAGDTGLFPCNISTAWTSKDHLAAAASTVECPGYWIIRNTSRLIFGTP